jgi:UDP-2-acetamido-3-amino-2,3-dideoxy-glucuronate N-acetyltransferase
MSDVFIHPNAIVETPKIGDGSRIWAFAYVLEGAEIGANANICSHTFIEGGVVIGDRVTVKSGVQLWDGVRVEDDVFIGPNATFTNDLFPRSKQRPEEFAKTLVCRHASIGANATILAGLTIGARAMIGAGAVVVRSVPPNAIVVGNPARIRGYVDSLRDGARAEAGAAVGEVGARESQVRGVSVHRLGLHRDIRGTLVAGEFGDEVPFRPKRSYLVFDVPSSQIRGEHAHRRCAQFIVCVRGACSLVVDDGSVREEFRLDHPTLGVHVPPMVWSTQFAHTPDAMLLVLASDHYDPGDYIREYPAFLEEVSRSPG